MVYDTDGKNSSSVHILNYKQCLNSLNNIVSTNSLNNIVSTLFTFALAFTMPQIFGSD